MEVNSQRIVEIDLYNIYNNYKLSVLNFYKTDSGYDDFLNVADYIVNIVASKDIQCMSLSKSGESNIHAVNVGILCCKIGHYLELNEDDIYDLVLGGILHDIGKNYIDPSVLNKPGKLSKFEMIAVSVHEEIGAKIINLFTDDKNVLGIINNHHKFIKSIGSPIKLTDIESNEYLFPIICGIADITDAIIAKRVYKPSFNLSVARDDMYGKGILDIDNIYKYIYL